jgi:hypothetical protein
MHRGSQRRARPESAAHPAGRGVTMHTTPDNQNLLELVRNARAGRLVLPQFQRNFVWSRDEVTELLKSVFQGHYIGSLLLLSTDKDNIPFAFRAIQGVDIKPEQCRPDAMILDGQQRLTSLHYAFSAPDDPYLRGTKQPYRFFLDLNQISTSVENWDMAIINKPASECVEYMSDSHQFETLLIPLTMIETWHDWLNRYEKWLSDKDRDTYFSVYFETQKTAWYELISRIQHFLVPTITIPKIKKDDQESLAEVCTIFEKLNTAGVKLSVYDLLTARLYIDKIELHTLWQQAIDTYHWLDVYSEGVPDEFGVFILRTIALLRGFDSKSKTLINLSPLDFETDWKRAVKYIDKALTRMTALSPDGFGVFDRKWMPYLTMVSPLAAMLAIIDEKKLGDTAYHWIQSWYWSSVFTERYASSVESSVYRDFQDFLLFASDPAFEGIALRTARTSIQDNQSFSILTVDRPNSIYRGIICLIALHGAKDFAADDAILFHTLEDHHIFPDAYLKSRQSLLGKPYQKGEINCIVNRTLIADQTNKRISNKKPSEYCRTIIPGDRVESILRSHLIDADAQRAIQTDDFEAFQSAREKALLHEIRQRIRG